MPLLKGSALYLSFLRPLTLPRVSKSYRSFSASPSNSSTSTSSTSTVSSSESKSIQIPESPPAAKPQLRSLPYRVNRTPTSHLPVYHDTKRGGNLKQTKLQKIEGDINTLRTELRDELLLDDKDIVINQLTKHIIIRSWRKPDVVKFLEERGF